MGGFRLNKWQRLVLVIGASVSFLWSYGIWQDDPSDGRPGTAFLAGIVLALMALTPPPAEEEALPFVRQVLNHKRLVAGLLALAALVLVVGWFASSEKAAESALSSVEDQTRLEKDEFGRIPPASSPAGLLVMAERDPFYIPPEPKGDNWLQDQFAEEDRRRASVMLRNGYAKTAEEALALARQYPLVPAERFERNLPMFETKARAAKMAERHPFYIPPSPNPTLDSYWRIRQAQARALITQPAATNDPVEETLRAIDAQRAAKAVP